MFELETIKELVKRLQNIDGVSKKQAQKIANWIIFNDNKNICELLEAIKNVKNAIVSCELCGYLSEQKICNICLDEDRDKVLIVVENVLNISKFEKDGLFYGKYFVFDNLIEDNKENDKLEEKTQKLISRASLFKEVILAISPTLKGEITSIYIKKVLEKNMIHVSKIAIGVPIGANIDYIDSMTLRQAIMNRKK